MADQQRNWQPNRDTQSNDQREGHQQANAFGQPQNSHYQANDVRPYMTGNVSWETPQSHRGKGPKGYKRSDDRIRDEVNMMLTEDDHVDATDIDVEVSNGEVTLNGTVGNRNDRRRAEEIIDRVSGVHHVQNNLRIRKDGSPAQGQHQQGTQFEKNSAGTTGLGKDQIM